MDILFTRDEMAHGRYKAVRQRGENKPLPPLDPKRVKLIDGKSYLEVYLIYILICFIFQTPSLNVLALSITIKQHHKSKDRLIKNVQTF